VKADGLTRLQLEDTLNVAFREFTIDPVVNVRFLNYKVTVMGEVLKPGTFTLPNERVTILEAIGMAGDLTVMGKRESVTVIREVNGKREVGKVNLLSSKVFESPYYYLRTNDVIYVEPAPAKFFARERLPQFISLAAGSLSLLAILLSLNK
jgi:polysaccharide export outer membrane protein